MWVRRWGRRADAVVRELHPASTSSPSWSCTGSGDTSAGNEAIPEETGQEIQAAPRVPV